MYLYLRPQNSWSNTLPSSRRRPRYEEADQFKKYPQHNYSKYNHSSPNQQHQPASFSQRNPVRIDQINDSEKKLLFDNGSTPIRADFKFVSI